jgi:hypothetical protein
MWEVRLSKLDSGIKTLYGRGSSYRNVIVVIQMLANTSFSYETWILAHRLSEISENYMMHRSGVLIWKENFLSFKLSTW